MDRNNFKNGQSIERIFRDAILSDDELVDQIKTKYSLPEDTELASALWQGNYGKKADVVLELGPQKYGVSLKSFDPSKVSLNQLTRTSIENACRRYLGEEHIAYFQERMLIKARKEGQLFPPEEQEKVKAIFQLAVRKFVKDAFALKAERAMFSIMNTETGESVLYKISDIFRHLSYKITFTRSGNLLVGDCILIHRKGGDGNDDRWEKTDIRHPSNQFQVKLKIKPFMELMEPYQIGVLQTN